MLEEKNDNIFSTLLRLYFSLMSINSTIPLSDYGTYTCPVCRHGQISAMPLMEETFACNFCRHIFVANLEKQLLKMADSQLPLTWCWDGHSWKGVYREGLEPAWVYWLAGAAFVIFPPTLVGVAGYLFPPIPESPLAWLPAFWTGLTLSLHLAFILWLVVQYYQFPVFLYLRALTQRWRSQ